MPGVIELVQELARQNLKLAIVSSAAYHPFLEWCIDSFELRPHFQAIVTSASCGIYKSNPAIYKHTLDMIEAEPEYSLHVGDSHRFDVASASAIGMLTALYGNPPSSALIPEPDIVIESLGDAAPSLVRLLERSRST
jgi:putative hydrolase of the HAD superfamily